jgi:hypothetical protein
MERHPLRKWSVLLLAIALVAFASVAGAQSPDEATLKQKMTPEEFEAAGLDKLDAGELAVLQEWIRRQQLQAAGTAAAAPAPTAVAAGAALSAAEVERIREEGREQGRNEVKQESRGFFDFGSEEPIKSTLVGEFRGFGKGKKYTLANGQVWEQIEPARLDGVRKTDPAVTIKPGILNVWFLRIDGYGTAAKVRRIK